MLQYQSHYCGKTILSLKSVLLKSISSQTLHNQLCLRFSNSSFKQLGRHIIIYNYLHYIANHMIVLETVTYCFLSKLTFCFLEEFSSISLPDFLINSFFCSRLGNVQFKLLKKSSISRKTFRRFKWGISRSLKCITFVNRQFHI